MSKTPLTPTKTAVLVFKKVFRGAPGRSFFQLSFPYYLCNKQGIVTSLEGLCLLYRGCKTNFLGKGIN